MAWGMTQKDFGLIVGFSGTYISGIECGHKKATLETQDHIRRIVALGKEGALKASAKAPIIRTPKELLDCTELIRAIGSAGVSVTLGDVLFLMELQQSLPAPINQDLVQSVVENRKKARQ